MPNSIPWTELERDYINWSGGASSVSGSQHPQGPDEPVPQTHAPTYPYRTLGLTEKNLAGFNNKGRRSPPSSPASSSRPSKKRRQTNNKSGSSSPSSPMSSSLSDVSDPGLSSNGSTVGSNSPPSPPLDNPQHYDFRTQDQAQWQDQLSGAPAYNAYPPYPLYDPQAQNYGGYQGQAQVSYTNYAIPSNAYACQNDFSMTDTQFASGPGASPSTEDSEDVVLVPHKRSRRIKNPEKVAHVRQMGACIRCRIGKYTCGEENPCARCLKEIPEVACQSCDRRRPSEIVGSMNLWGSSPARTPRSPGAEVKYLSVTFGQINNLLQDRPLRLAVQDQYSPSTGMTDVLLSQYSVPTPKQLEAWVDNQMDIEELEMDSMNPFRSKIEYFVRQYANSKYTTKRVSLVRQVHTMQCMFRIWKSDGFFINNPNNPHNFDRLPVMADQQLRGLARSTIRHLERDILAEFDRSTKDPLPSKSKDTDLPLWACLWQTAFIYTDFYELGVVEVEVLPTIKTLFTTLMVMVGTNFRNLSPINSLRDHEANLLKSCGGDTEVFRTFGEVAMVREMFHSQVFAGCQMQVETCILWRDLVINRETDLDRRRKKGSKGSSK